MSSDEVVFAILAKQKGAVLPLFLRCLLNQTLDKKKIHLFIRTNDNTDNTEDLLVDFIAEHGEKYASVVFDNSSVSERLRAYAPHEWNCERFKILGRIRQDSIDYAISRKAHYFVADCDNFIIPTCLEKMIALKELGVVAPMLVTTTKYLNIHYATDANGYLREHPVYDDILYRRLVGCIRCDVVHCTYFIANGVLPEVSYDDGSNRYEYAIFSDVLRKKKINQYIDNRVFYGFITFADTVFDFENEINNHWAKSLVSEFGIEFDSVSTTKASYSAAEEDKKVAAFYNNKIGGYYVSLRGADSNRKFNNTTLLEKKYGWKGVCIEGMDWSEHGVALEKNIDYLSVELAGGIQKFDFDKYTVGCVSVSNVNDELKERMKAKGFICARVGNDGAIFYNGALFNGTYYFNKDKSYPHEVSFNARGGIINVRSEFPWKEDIGILDSETLVIQFCKLGRRSIGADTITLHSNDKWYKM